jgi:dienelactone hydrolase
MIEEKIVVGHGTKYPLNGLLTLPDAQSNDIPAVVLVQGSGSSDMDAKVAALTPFKDIAAQLAAKGIASIRYDKRSKAHPLKMIRDPDGLTIREETIYDAVLAADMLRKHPRIGKVFIFGHSQGGMQAGRIDAEGGNFDGLIIAAGSTRSLREIMRDQTKEELFGRKGLIKRFADRQTARMMSKLDGIENLTDEEAKQKKLFGGTTAYYFLEMERNPPSTYLADIDKPVFVFQGDKDFHVSVEKDFEGFREILGDNPHATFKVYSGLNHAFTTSVATGTIKDYKVPGKVDTRVTDDIADWIHALT